MYSSHKNEHSSSIYLSFQTCLEQYKGEKMKIVNYFICELSLFLVRVDLMDYYFAQYVPYTVHFSMPLTFLLYFIVSHIY